MDDGHRWKRLTVSEAADSLQISKDAVRKRVQRGSLRHEKTLDGHLYVYLDEGPDAGKDKVVPVEAHKDSGQNKRSFMDYVAPAAPIVAGVGGATYILGLVTLWAPIAWSYTHDFDTAWYAVSLVPKTTVAGLGVRYLLAPALLYTMPGTVVSALLYRWYKTSRLRETIPDYWRRLLRRLFGSTLQWPARHRTERKRISPIPPQINIAIVAFIVFAFFVLVFIRENPEVQAVYANKGIPGLLEDRRIAEDILTFVSAIILTTLGVLYGALVFMRSRRGDTSFREAFRLREAGGIFFIFFIGYAFYAFTILVFAREPPLPTAEITGRTETEGKLLGHTDGFWYVIKEDNVIAIPDGEVRTVKVSTLGE